MLLLVLSLSLAFASSLILWLKQVVVLLLSSLLVGVGKEGGVGRAGCCDKCSFFLLKTGSSKNTNLAEGLYDGRIIRLSLCKLKINIFKIFNILRMLGSECYMPNQITQNPKLT